jgi:Flp pilus assembly pilin Flp
MGRPIRLITLAIAALRRWLNLAHASIYAGASGQGLVEYGLILVLIMVVCVGILSQVGNTVSSVWYDKIIDSFPH